MLCGLLVNFIQTAAGVQLNGSNHFLRVGSLCVPSDQITDGRFGLRNPTNLHRPVWALVGAWTGQFTAAIDNDSFKIALIRSATAHQIQAGELVENNTQSDIYIERLTAKTSASQLLADITQETRVLPRPELGQLGLRLLTSDISVLR